MSKLIRCRIKINEGLEDVANIDIDPGSDKDYEAQIKKIFIAMSKQNEIFERNFISVVNCVVKNNGVITIDIEKCRYNIYSSHIEAKIPKESIEIIRGHPNVESLDEM
jgi:hypothetical protein